MEEYSDLTIQECEQLDEVIECQIEDFKFIDEEREARANLLMKYRE